MALTETAVREQTMLERVITIKPAPRIEKLRETLLDLKPKASIERARIETRVLKETEGEPYIIRRAKIFAAVAREMPIHVYPDELLVGCVSSERHCNNISPMNASIVKGLSSSWAEDTGIERAGASDLSDEDKKELDEVLTPYWRTQGPQMNQKFLGCFAIGVVMPGRIMLE